MHFFNDKKYILLYQIRYLYIKNVSSALIVVKAFSLLKLWFLLKILKCEKIKNKINLLILNIVDISPSYFKLIVYANF